MTSTAPRSGHGLVRNSVAIAMASNLAALLGYVYWSVCTHALPTSEVGITSTCVSAIMMTALAVTGGFVPLLIRSLATADVDELSGLCGTAVVLVAIVGAAGGAALGLALPPAVRAAVSPATRCALMAFGSAGAALLLVVTAMHVGVRRADLAFVGNMTASSVRLVMVVPVLGAGLFPAVTALRGVAVQVNLLIWACSFAVAVPLCLWLLRRAVPGLRLRPDRRWLPRLRRGHGWEYVITLGVQSPTFLLPILAAARIPAEQVAFLYMTLMVASAFYSVAGATSTALLSDCAGTPGRLTQQTTRAVLITVAVLLVPGVVTCLWAPGILGLFGGEYARHGSTLLVLLVVASLPDVFVAVSISVCRLSERLAVAAALTLLKGAAVLAGSWYLLPRIGVEGTGWSFVVANGVGMIIVLAARRSGRPTARGSSRHDIDAPSVAPELLGSAKEV